MADLSVERSIWIDAPAERVWQAITEPDHLARWFLPAMPGAQMRRDDGGTLSVVMGPMEAAMARLEAADPRRQVTLRTLPDQLIASTYTLAEQNGGTQVTVSMTGFESLPADAREDRLSLSRTGWEQALANLKADLDGADLPYPQAFVGPLFGFWREPKEKIAIERTIWINAPRERVWRAITDPNEIEHWFSPGTSWGGTGVEVGGRVFVKDPETGAELYTQIIDVVDPPHRLVTRSQPEPPATPETTIWTLLEENGGTRLILTYTGYELMSADIRRSKMEENAFGFGMMLQNLQAYVEGETLPFPMGF